MEYKYVVTYKNYDGEVNCKVMTGHELANMYGFTDCTGYKVISVWRVTESGNLFMCLFYGSWKAPYNRLIVERGIGDTVIYDWDEH